MKQAILNNTIVDIDDFSTKWYNMSFKCKCCNENVIICHGIERQYFRHQKNSDCAYSLYSQEKDSQSLEHIICKEYLFNELKNANKNIFIQQEYPISNGFDKCIVDVYAEYSFNDPNFPSFKGQTFKYAFEIQKSPKSEKALIAKNNFYKNLNIIPIWISIEGLNINPYQTNTNAFYHRNFCSGSYKFEVKNKKASIFYKFSSNSFKKFDLFYYQIPLKNFKLYGSKIFYL